MGLAPGLRLGPYEVLSALGAGGMGEVYRARDSRLGRDIALKVIGELHASSPDQLRRFEQEARLAGSLNHPNLISVHDFGVHEGTPYLVTELLSGENLRNRLSRGPVPRRLALEWAVQLARGLAAAHARGIVHRDVKPENVFITGDDQVKLLDFGVAKPAVTVPGNDGHGLLDPTLTPTGRVTHTGSIVGTPGYMSPEQLGGAAVDARTDVFSLGAVLFELLSGRRAFPGASVFESGNAVLHGTPELPDDVPPAIAQIVERCLEREPARRFQTMSDLAFALQMARDGTVSSPAGLRTAAAPSRGQKARKAAAAVALIALAAIAGFVLVRPGPVRPSLVDDEKLTYRLGRIGAARLLPDGRVVYSASFEGQPEALFVRPAGSVLSQALDLRRVRLLAASPSGELAILVHLDFDASWVGPGTLARVPSVGGPPREITDNVEAADWSPAGELAIVRRAGATASLEFPIGRSLFRTSGSLTSPRFSPRGDLIAVLHHPVFLDSMGEVLVLDLEGKVRMRSSRWPTTGGLAWTPDGREVWIAAGPQRQNMLIAHSLSGKPREVFRSLSHLSLEDIGPRGEVLVNSTLGRAEVVHQAAEGLQRLLSWTDWNTQVAKLSGAGKVLFSADQPVAPGSQNLTPSWALLRAVDGEPAQVLAGGRAFDLSSDGRWALVGSTDGTALTAVPTGVGNGKPVTTAGMYIAAARWAPDGGEVLAVARAGEDEFRLYRMSSDGGAPRRVSETPLVGFWTLEVSQDGRWAATIGSGQLLIVSLVDGSASPLPEHSRNAVPRGWTRSGDLWITEQGPAGAEPTRLLRVDRSSGQVREERSLRLADPSGASGLIDVALSPDGREVAIGFNRRLDTLYLLRGLPKN